ncbi:Gustatory receptor 107a, partial [Halyomorpha halys]
MVETNDDEMCDMEAAVYDLLSIPRFIGTFPFDQNHKFVPYRLIFLIGNFIAYAYVRSATMPQDLSVKRLTVISFLFLIMILPPIIHLIWLYINVSSLKEFYFKITQVGKYFQSVGVKLDTSCMWIHKYLSLILILKVSVIGICLFPKFFYLYFIHFSWLYVSIYSLYDQIFGIFLVTRESFSRLKDITNDHKLLQNREIMVSICKAVEKLFSMQILFIISTSFIIFLLVFFQILNKQTKIYWIYQWPVLSLTVYPIIRMITSVRSIIMQVKKIDKHLYKRLMANPYD